MATNIPPHNINEIIDAAILVVQKPNSTLADVMKFVPGPDFPTGGFLLGQNGIYDYFTKGRGSLKLRAKVTREEIGRDREALIVDRDPLPGKQSAPDRADRVARKRKEASKASRTSAMRATARACASSSS